MKLSLYQADAFTDKLFGGNPAAVCILNSWLPDVTMQSIAAENNLAETAFIVKAGARYEIRWFTPTVEVDLCGHATLASAHILFERYNMHGDTIEFYSPRSGVLKVTKQDGLLSLDFPKDVFEKVTPPAVIAEGIGITPLETFRGKTDYMAVVSSQSEVENIRPDFNKISQLNARGLIVTAPGGNCDFVSRFFAPQSGIDEDPVTGSSHTTLTPYWSEKLGRKTLTAMQLSARKGYLQCTDKGERVEISGKAVTYLVGEIDVEDNGGRFL